MFGRAIPFASRQRPMNADGARAKIIADQRHVVRPVGQRRPVAKFRGAFGDAIGEALAGFRIALVQHLAALHRMPRLDGAEMMSQ